MTKRMVTDLVAFGLDVSTLVRLRAAMEVGRTNDELLDRVLRRLAEPLIEQARREEREEAGSVACAFAFDVGRSLERVADWSDSCVVGHVEDELRFLMQDAGEPCGECVRLETTCHRHIPKDAS